MQNVSRGFRSGSTSQKARIDMKIILTASTKGGE
jgi:hypothetical protein